MFFISDHKKDYSEKVILIANYLLEKSGKNENCKMGMNPYMWFSDITIKYSSVTRVLCRASVLIPFNKESCLIVDVKERPFWVYFEFNTMKFELESIDLIESIYCSAIKHFHV